MFLLAALSHEGKAGCCFLMPISSDKAVCKVFTSQLIHFEKPCLWKLTMVSNGLDMLNVDNLSYCSAINYLFDGAIVVAVS